MDRAYNGPVMVASAQGGMDIEDVAESNPEAILTEPIDIIAGVQEEQTSRLADALGFDGPQKAMAQQQMSNLYDLFIGTDATQVEINPFAKGRYFGRDDTEEPQVFCVDAKLGFDDNSEYRQKDVYAMRDTSMEDQRDVEAEEIGVQVKRANERVRESGGEREREREWERERARESAHTREKISE